MSIVDSILAIDAPVFVNPDLIPGGEAVTYKPGGTGGRAINANVERDPPEQLGTDGSVRRPKMYIEVANSATAGISATEINYGLDRITVAYPKGATAADHAIVGTLLSQDAGMIRLELA